MNRRGKKLIQKDYHESQKKPPRTELKQKNQLNKKERAKINVSAADLS